MGLEVVFADLEDLHYLKELDYIDLAALGFHSQYILMQASFQEVVRYFQESPKYSYRGNNYRRGRGSLFLFAYHPGSGAVQVFNWVEGKDEDGANMTVKVHPRRKAKGKTQESL